MDKVHAFLNKVERILNYFSPTGGIVGGVAAIGFMIFVIGDFPFWAMLVGIAFGVFLVGFIWKAILG